MNLKFSLQRIVLGVAMTGFAFAGTPTAYAQHAHEHESRSAAAGMKDGAPVALEGRLAILDFVYLGGAGRERIHALVADDGSATRVVFRPGAGELRQGMTLAVSGHASRGAIIVEQTRFDTKRSIATAKGAVTVEGTVQLLYADNFDGGTSRFIWALRQDDGEQSELDLALAPRELKSGMRVTVTGQRNAIGLAPDSIAVLAEAPARDAALAAAVAAAPQTASVLVILLNFQPTPPATVPAQPFLQSAVQNVVFTGSTSVANYWSEASFGNQLMTGTVTPWLTASFQTPSTCNYTGIATEAKRVAQLAGYNLANYQKFVYLFTRVSACGWAGLGEVPGSQAWSNQYNTLGVIGHEIGHNWGLGHANSLPCNGVTIATNCPANRPEYGDPWGIMGNQSSRHVNAWQKNDLGWIPDAQVATHPGGSATYTLSPLELPGGTLYAVQIPAAGHRTYWLEYRQATGFDAGLPANATSGAIVHLGGLMHQADHSEYGCWDTCFLDMAPATGTMTDGALPVPTAFVDQLTGVTISSVSIGAGGLTVSVASPPTGINLGLYRKVSPSSGAPVYKFLLDYGFDHTPDGKISYGMAGDVPLVGNLSYDGMTSLIIYRNGFWYLDTNRDGTSNQTVALGGVPGDIPLTGNFTGPGWTDDLVIYRNGTWYVDQYFNGTVNKTFRFGGVPGDIPRAADVNGDGIADLAIYRNGLWYIDTNRDGNADLTITFGGAPQDLPLLFDWDGDGKADLCVYRDGLWYVNTRRDGTLQTVFGYGAAGDIPFGGKFY